MKLSILRYLWILLPAVSFAQSATLVGLPDKPHLTPEGKQLILDYECGGGKPYYDRYLARPTWPGAASGVTVGVGYDLGYNTRPVILSDWRALSSAPRLANVSGFKGESARSRVSQVRDIVIAWSLAEQVYDSVTVTKFWLLCRRTWPGFDDLHPNAQAALLSLTFNRGNSLIGERRREMKEIARLSPKQDYNGMAAQIIAMKRIWRGTSIQTGMYRRRDAEARLMRMVN